MKSPYAMASDKILGILLVLACFSIPLGIAFMSIFMGLFVMVWAFSGDYANKFERIGRHPAAWVSIVLFGLYGLGMLYSNAAWSERLAWWLKYHKLLYVPLIIAVVRTDKLRQLALDAFLASMVLVLTISYLKWLGLVPTADLGQGYIVFKSRITHNILMAFSAYLLLQRAMAAVNYRRWLWIALAVLAVLNTLFLVNGRTGQVVLLVLLLWFCWETWGEKSLAWMLFAASLAFVVHQIVPDIPHSRLTEVSQEIAEHNPHGVQTSSGQRLEFYQNTFALIRQHPLFGAGTGSFRMEYQQLAEAKKLAATHNPHNEFLLTGQELGAMGLLSLLIFMITHWLASYQLTQAPYGYVLRGLILTLFVGSLFNSFLLDSGEGRFYCVLAGVLLSAYIPARKTPLDENH